jgi:hypothetical protein
LLQPKYLEDRFFEMAIEKIKDEQSGEITEHKKNLKTKDKCKELETLYEKYINPGNNKIYLIVDTQKALYECIKANKDETRFATVITRESVYDPASKVDINQPGLWVNKFKPENVLIETNSAPRTYSGNEIVGNFNIMLSPVNASAGNINIQFKISNKSDGKIVIDPTYCKMNSSSKHPNCISFLNKKITSEIAQIRKIYKTPKITDISNIIDFYTEGEGFIDYLKSILRSDDIKKITKLCAYFTQKRLGDALQAEACLYLKKLLLFV